MTLRAPVVTESGKTKCHVWIDLTMAVPDADRLYSDDDDDREYICDDYWSAACNKDEGHEGPHYLVLDDDEELADEDGVTDGLTKNEYQREASGR